MVADALAGGSQVLAAAKALALVVLPAEGQLGQPLAAEHHGRHADVRGIVPVLPDAAHFPGAVGGEGGKLGPSLQSFHKLGEAVGFEHHVVVETHDPWARAEGPPLVAGPGDGLPAIGVSGPGRSGQPVDAEQHASL